MLPRRTARRKCSEQEREWRGFCVDKNLEDDWLARLNGLNAFNLISICEGHYDQAETSKKSPHIKLRLKERLLPNVVRHWDEHKMAVLTEVSHLFQTGNTYVNLEMQCKLRLGTGRLTYQESVVMRVHGRRARTSGEIDAPTGDWFRQNVSHIEEIDSLIARLWDESRQDDLQDDLKEG